MENNNSDLPGSDARLRLIIIDDEPISRLALTWSLESHADLQVLSEACDAVQAMQILQNCEADILIMDLTMPNMDGVEATRLIKSLHPLIKILILTSVVDPRDVKEALLAGADGYCLKDACADKLISALRCLQNNQQFIDPELQM